jgi:YHS domain-containing protein
MKTTGIIATFAFAAMFAVAVPGCQNGAKTGDDGSTPTTQPSTGSGSATADAADEASSESSDETTSETADTSAEQQSNAGTPVNEYCAVEQQHPADSKITYTHNGKTFAFCCEDCIDTFKKEPTQYTDAR